MKRVDRPETPPEVLSHPEFMKMRGRYLAFLRLSGERRAQTRPPPRSLPDLPGLLAAVAAPFDGKCAFCGIETAQRVYRFRPTMDAQPQRSDGTAAPVLPDSGTGFSTFPGTFGTGSFPWNSRAKGSQPARSGVPHLLYYGWLADAWQNLYPICTGCQPADARQFPVAGERCALPSASDYAAYASENSGRWAVPIRESALLVDPCEDDPEKEMRLRADGLLEGLSEGGQLTIDFFNLNRSELVKKRASERAATPRAGRARRKPRQPVRWELCRIRIENFKAIERLDLDMPPCPQGGPDRAAALLILGENAAGKSTVLEAVALAMMSGPARRKLLRKPATYLLNPRFMGDADLPARSQGRIMLDFVAGDRPAQVVATLTAQGMTVENTNRSLPQVFGYGAYRHYLDGVQRRSADRGVMTLFRSDALLSNPRDWLMRLSPERFDEVVATLRYVFGVDFDAIRRSEEDCMVVMRIEGVETETPLLAVSSGFRTVLALVCDALRWLTEAPATSDLRLVDMPALILIDEVEAHLHPRWKMAIVDGLRRALPAATFLVTTHDPLCLRRAAPDEVRVMTRTLAEGRTTLPVLVEALDQLPEMGVLTVDQLLTADFFGLGDTDDPASVRALENLSTQYASGVPDPAASDVVQRLQAQLLRDLPIGRTEVERIVQEALRDYLTERRRARPEWRAQTRDRILDLLRTL